MDSFKSWTKNEELKSWARDTVASIENCVERMKDKRLSDKDRDSFGVMLVQLSQAIKHDAEYPNNQTMRDMSDTLLDAFDALINEDVAAFEVKYEILRQLSFFGEVLLSEKDRAAFEAREDGRTYIDFIPTSLTNEQSNQIIEHLQSIGAKFDPKVGQWYVEADWKMPELSQGGQENNDERQPERLNGENMEYKERFSVLIQNRTEFEKGGHTPMSEELSLPATKEELHEVMKKLNITAENSHDFFLVGYSTDKNSNIYIPSDWIRDGDLNKINFLAARLREMTTEQFEKLSAIMQRDFVANRFTPKDLNGLINETFNVDAYSFIPGLITYNDLGSYLLNDSGKVHMPEEWKEFVDKWKLGYNTAKQENGEMTENGYLARNMTEWKELFTGKEIPERYCIMSFPESERTNKEQDMTEKQENITNEAKYKAIYYDGKARKEVFADTKENALQAVQEAKPDRKETDRCYIQEREADSENYKNEGIYLIESGRDVTPVEFRFPYMSKNTFVAVTQEIKNIGAKFNGDKHVWYVERSIGEDVINQIRDYLNKHDEGIYLNLPKLPKAATKEQLMESAERLEQIKQDGARYNSDKKAWYITEKTDRSKFADYLPAEKPSIHAKIEQNKKTAEQSGQEKDRSIEPKNKENHERE